MINDDNDKAVAYITYRISRISRLTIHSYNLIYRHDNWVIGLYAVLRSEAGHDSYCLPYLYPEYQTAEYYHTLFSEYREHQDRSNRCYISIRGSDDLNEYYEQYDLQYVVVSSPELS